MAEVICDSQPVNYQAKPCSKCGEIKPLSDFNRHSIGRDGRRPDCRSCQKLRMQKYWSNSVEKRRDSGRKYYLANKETINKKNRKWVKDNPDAARAHQRRAAHKRLKTPKGKVTRFVKDGIRKSILVGSKRGRHVFDLLGYTADDLKRHLEKQFLPGMTWENYGRYGWHIDHIIPLSAFNYETPEHVDFRRAWALENLRPLWAFDNLSKHAKLDAPFQPSLLIP